MAISALLRFTQGTLVGSGIALSCLEGLTVQISNADNTGVGSWRLELLYEPPASHLGAVPGTPHLIAESGSGGVPTGSLLPTYGAFGCYRVHLTVWDGTGFTGNYAEDIRAIGIATPEGDLIPPPQLDPKPLKPPHPDELNFEGQPYGWAGAPLRSGSLVNNTLEKIARKVGVPAGQSVDQHLSPKPAYIMDFPKRVTTTTGYDYHVAMGPNDTTTGPYSVGDGIVSGTVGGTWRAHNLSSGRSSRFLIKDPTSGKVFLIRNSYNADTPDISDVLTLDPLVLNSTSNLFDLDLYAALGGVSCYALGGGYMWIGSPAGRVLKVSGASPGNSHGLYGTGYLPSPLTQLAYAPGGAPYPDAYGRVWALSPGGGVSRFSEANLAVPEIMAQIPSGYTGGLSAGLALEGDYIWSTFRSNSNGQLNLVRSLAEPALDNPLGLEIGPVDCQPMDVVYDPGTSLVFVYWQEGVASTYLGYTFNVYVGVYKYDIGSGSIVEVRKIQLPTSWGAGSHYNWNDQPTLNIFGGKCWGVTNGEAEPSHVGGNQANHNYPMVREYHIFNIDLTTLNLEDVTTEVQYQWDDPADTKAQVRYANTVGPWSTPNGRYTSWRYYSQDDVNPIVINLPPQPQNGDKVVFWDDRSDSGMAGLKVVSANPIQGHQDQATGTYFVLVHETNGWLMLEYRTEGNVGDWHVRGRSEGHGTGWDATRESAVYPRSNKHLVTRGSFNHYVESYTSWTKVFDLRQIVANMQWSPALNSWLQTIKYTVQLSPSEATWAAESFTGTLLVRRNGVTTTVLAQGTPENIGGTGTGSIAWSVSGTTSDLTLTATATYGGNTCWSVWLDCIASWGGYDS